MVTQLIQAVYNWASVVDAKGQTGVVFLNFNKAFDTVLHTRLLKKLHHYGISDKTNDWISTLMRGLSPASLSTEQARHGHQCSLEYPKAQW